MGIQGLGWMMLIIIGMGLCGARSGWAAEGNAERELVVQGNNAFALDLYAHLKAEPGNLFFCPYSIRTALTMTYAGARNKTARQMAHVLHLNLEPQRLHQVVQAWLHELVTSSSGQQDYQLLIANALWGQQDYEFLDEFCELLHTSYDAGLRTVDFVKSPEEARKTINSWVTEQTQGKIRELIKPRDIDTLTVLVLTNAIYFKGRWALPFDAEKTVDTPFTMINGDTITIPMMHQTIAVNYGEDDNVQILELPYEGAQLSMILVLPKDLTQLPALESALSVEYLEQQLSKLREQKVVVGIPKFTMTSEFSLSEVLKAMGMTDAFALPPADFSGISRKQDLWISEVLHQAFVDVNEEGTEATAATAVVMARGLRQHPVFLADHPFLFLIRDNRSSGILFLGRVMDPRGTEK